MSKTNPIQPTLKEQVTDRLSGITGQNGEVELNAALDVISLVTKHLLAEVGKDLNTKKMDDLARIHNEGHNCEKAQLRAAIEGVGNA